MALFFRRVLVTIADQSLEYFFLNFLGHNSKLQILGLCVLFLYSLIKAQNCDLCRDLEGVVGVVSDVAKKVRTRVFRNQSDNDIDSALLKYYPAR